MNPLIWLAIGLAFLLLEVITLGLYAVFVVIGALAAALAAQLGTDLWVQVLVFALASVVGIGVARPPLMRYMQRRRTPELLSGARSMIGRDAPVTTDIGGSHQPGHVRVLGEDWPAITVDDTSIASGAIVTVVDLKAATLVVKKKEG